ncbi:unnamed protein product [Polarella glacialis]|uniref:Uncharacterized protein n=1 Tax=Polarella glacialis TaxID=89957 RepID=A0A813JI82_POLGL|nr:unnamed protein product [Polarella glacialis]
MSDTSDASELTPEAVDPIEPDRFGLQWQGASHGSPGGASAWLLTLPAAGRIILLTAEGVIEGGVASPGRGVTGGRAITLDPDTVRTHPPRLFERLNGTEGKVHLCRSLPCTRIHLSSDTGNYRSPLVHATAFARCPESDPASQLDLGAVWTECRTSAPTPALLDASIETDLPPVAVAAAGAAPEVEAQGSEPVVVTEVTNGRRRHMAKSPQLETEFSMNAGETLEQDRPPTPRMSWFMDHTFDTTAAQAWYSKVAAKLKWTSQIPQGDHDSQIIRHLSAPKVAFSVLAVVCLVAYSSLFPGPVPGGVLGSALYHAAKAAVVVASWVWYLGATFVGPVMSSLVIGSVGAWCAMSSGIVAAFSVGSAVFANVFSRAASAAGHAFGSAAGSAGGGAGASSSSGSVPPSGSAGGQAPGGARPGIATTPEPAPAGGGCPCGAPGVKWSTEAGRQQLAQWCAAKSTESLPLLRVDAEQFVPPSGCRPVKEYLLPGSPTQRVMELKGARASKESLPSWLDEWNMRLAAAWERVASQCPHEWVLQLASRFGDTPGSACAVRSRSLPPASHDLTSRSMFHGSVVPQDDAPQHPRLAGMMGLYGSGTVPLGPQDHSWNPVPQAGSMPPSRQMWDPYRDPNGLASLGGGSVYHSPPTANRGMSSNPMMSGTPVMTGGLASFGIHPGGVALHGPTPWPQGQMGSSQSPPWFPGPSQNPHDPVHGLASAIGSLQLVLSKGNEDVVRQLERSNRKDEARGGDRHTIAGITREDELLKFALGGCDTQPVALCPGETGKEWIRSMRAAVLERRSDLIKVDCPVKIDFYVALAVSLCSWGIPEDGESPKVYLDAKDFPALGADELQRWRAPPVSDSVLRASGRDPLTIETWAECCGRLAYFFGLVYGRHHEPSIVECIAALRRKHNSDSRTWSFLVVQRIFSNLLCRYLTEWRQIVRNVIRLSGHEDPNKSHVRRICQTLGPDGAPVVQPPKVFDLEDPEGHFQKVIYARMQRNVHQALWANAYELGNPKPGARIGGDAAYPQGPKVAPQITRLASVALAPLPAAAEKAEARKRETRTRVTRRVAGLRENPEDLEGRGSPVGRSERSLRSGSSTWPVSVSKLSDRGPGTGGGRGGAATQRSQRGGRSTTFRAAGWLNTLDDGVQLGGEGPGGGGGGGGDISEVSLRPDTLRLRRTTDAQYRGMDEQAQFVEELATLRFDLKETKRFQHKRVQDLEAQAKKLEGRKKRLEAERLPVRAAAPEAVTDAPSVEEQLRRLQQLNERLRAQEQEADEELKKLASSNCLLLQEGISERERCRRREGAQQEEASRIFECLDELAASEGSLLRDARQLRNRAALLQKQVAILDATATQTSLQLQEAEAAHGQTRQEEQATERRAEIIGWKLQVAETQLSGSRSGASASEIFTRQRERSGSESGGAAVVAGSSSSSSPAGTTGGAVARSLAATSAAPQGDCPRLPLREEEPMD